MGGKCQLTTGKRQAVITVRNEKLSYRGRLSKTFNIFELCGLHHEKAPRKWQELYSSCIFNMDVASINKYTAWYRYIV